MYRKLKIERFKDTYSSLISAFEWPSKWFIKVLEIKLLFSLMCLYWHFFPPVAKRGYVYIVSLFLHNIVCIVINTSFSNFVFFPVESNGGEFKIIWVNNQQQMVQWNISYTLSEQNRFISRKNNIFTAQYMFSRVYR